MRRGTKTANTLQRGAHDSLRIHWPRTLMSKAASPLAYEHLRFHRRAAQGGLLHCLVLDCSASMLRHRNLALAKGLLLHWVRHIYRQRAELAVIAFAGRQARILQPPTKAVAFNEQWIGAIRGGGGTPVVSGMQLAENLLRQVRRNTPDKKIGLWLLTDGRFSELPAPSALADFSVVVDFENAAVPLHRAERIAENWGAALLRAADLAPAF